ncbi:hypothetical protein M5K25_019748 [Dendrobium thyrsiflorum]|uniref:Uncharacterized protein n=1 Tax=Dendrobium thyrsiflorum TaxID=117978 RepID=A0ABD0UFH9_DENTH
MAVKRVSDPDFFNASFKSRSFMDALSGSPSIAFPELRQCSFRGLPSLWISEEETLALAVPFQYALLFVRENRKATGLRFACVKKIGGKGFVRKLKVLTGDASLACVGVEAENRSREAGWRDQKLQDSDRVTPSTLLIAFSLSSLPEQFL